MRASLPTLSLLLVANLLLSCAGPQATASAINIEVAVGGRVETYEVPAGSTVQQALAAAGVELGDLDRTEPPTYTVLTDGARVEITRVDERFEIEEIIIPYERQTVRNEGLPEGDSRLLQAGSNGVEEITYRIVEEGGEEVSRTPVKRTVIEPAQPEVVMVGAQTAITPVGIEGRLAYLSGGNAWLMEANTGNRRPIVVSGDLDGRVFELSPGGEFLLYTRAADEEGEGINSLWATAIDDEDAEPIDLGAANVVHFADWAPEADPLRVAYSTAESSPAPPGWQANNDLVLLTLSGAGRVLREETLVPANAGGQYGWWGTDYHWAPDGVHLGYARADSIGLIDIREPAPSPITEIVPFQTLGDWAWVPGLSWGRDSRTLFYVDHGEPVGLEEDSASPVFNVAALPPQGGGIVPLRLRAGMFAQPEASPSEVLDSGEVAYRIAFYQAIAPLQSQDSAYRLGVMDRDGSNAEVIFPNAETLGLRGDDLQQPPAWSPDGERVALRYRGNLWIVDASTGQGQQVTGDGSAAAYDWQGR